MSLTNWRRSKVRSLSLTGRRRLGKDRASKGCRYQGLHTPMAGTCQTRKIPFQRLMRLGDNLAHISANEDWQSKEEKILMYQLKIDNWIAIEDCHNFYFEYPPWPLSRLLGSSTIDCSCMMYEIVWEYSFISLSAVLNSSIMFFLSFFQKISRYKMIVIP